jgi:GNAT superfamily N-acetyltransferase
VTSSPVWGTRGTPISPEIRIRQATREDAQLIFDLILELAEYEKLSDQVHGSAELLERSLFDRGAGEALVLEVDGEPAGYAIFFTTFSTFETRPGIWLEDIYVRPRWRRLGIATAVMERLAALAVERDCARLEWVALDWNEPALRFYDQLGAEPIEGWQALRLSGDALRRLGASR